MNCTLVSDNIFWMELKAHLRQLLKKELWRPSGDRVIFPWMYDGRDGRSAFNTFFFWLESDTLIFVFIVIGEKVYYNLWNQRLLSTFVIQSLVKCYHKMIGLITRSVLWYYPNIETSTLSCSLDSRQQTLTCLFLLYPYVLSYRNIQNKRVWAVVYINDQGSRRPQC